MPHTASVIPAPGLAEVARRVAAGRAGPAELLECFLAATVFCEAPDSPGVVPALTPQGPVVCMHSSLAELAAARGSAAWFSTTGIDLLDLLPAGHDLLLDPASEHVLRLRPASLRKAVRVQ